jgi:glutamate-5-semialdehyde dehydrogenase
MIRLRGEIDLIVPRGGAGLIEFVRANAQIPVLAGGVGVCHTYVHQDADLAQAVAIVHNAKTRRPTVCNALDTVLVHAAIAPSFTGPGPAVDRSLGGDALRSSVP